MRIGGLQKFSLIDYPGHIAAVIFTQGCLFRCHYCHNPELVLPQKFQTPIPFEEVLSFLEMRKGKLEGVVISGGEPTLQAKLIPSLEKIKAKGFAIKLDTSGVMPDVLKKLIQRRLVNYIAMDIKAPLSCYQEVTNTHVDIQKIKDSIALIKDSSLPHEFRTTLLKPFHGQEDIVTMAQMIQGCQNYVLQKYKPGKTLSSASQHFQPFSDQELVNSIAMAKPYVTALSKR